VTGFSVVPDPSPGPADRGVVAELCPDGPMLLRGVGAVRDEQGRLHEASRPVVAVCMCRRSQRQPWCDGTHKSVRTTRPAPGA
jgi:hypothetical protein